MDIEELEEVYRKASGGNVLRIARDQRSVDRVRHSLSSYVARNHEATYEDAIEKWIDSPLLADYAAPGLEWGGTVCSKREGLLIKESWGEGLQDSDRSLYQSVIIIKATETK